MTVQLEGFHAVKHALRFAPDLVRTVTVADLAATRALCRQLAPDLLDVMTDRAQLGAVAHPTGVQATTERPVENRDVLVRRSSPLVLLDDPRHPGNAGAVIRVAAAAGAGGVIMTGRLDPWHPAVLRGSAGLHYALPVLSAAPAEVVGPLIVLAADGQEWYGLPDDAVVVVGSERAGVGDELRDRANAIVRLPMRAGVSSLNLATATAAALYAWRLPRPSR